MLTIVNTVLALGTLFIHILLFLGVIITIFFRKKGNPIISVIGKYGLHFAWITALLATLTSLFYSDVAGFEPCTLCWYQRIFMYPLIFILGLGILKRDTHIAGYALLLSYIGGIFALYHNYIYYGGTSILPCDAFGLGVSCVKRYVFELGYITIPLMALTSFLLLTIFLWSSILYEARQSKGDIAKN